MLKSAVAAPAPFLARLDECGSAIDQSVSITSSLVLPEKRVLQHSEKHYMGA